MDITFTLPDSDAERFFTALAAMYGYQNTVQQQREHKDEKTGEAKLEWDTIPNPQSKEDFVKSKILENLLSSVYGYEADKAQAEALASVKQPQPIDAEVKV